MARMPHSSKWQQVLAKLYGASRAGVFVARAQAYYAGYCAQHSGEKNRAQRANLKANILPGLSIYRALLDENPDRERALAEVEALFKETFFTARLRGIRWLNHWLPDPFFVVRPALKLLAREEYLPGAQEIVEDSKDCFALNTYRCFILDTLTLHGAAELTALYCKTDDWLASAMPKVSWERTKTLGRGDDCCDFRWRRIK